jgi:miniconductance mechanosensitive channel
MFNIYEELLRKWLVYLNFSEVGIDKGIAWICLLTFIIISIIIYYASLLVIKKVVFKLILKTSNTIDDELFDSKVFHKLIYILPIMIIDNGLKSIIRAHSLPLMFINRAIEVCYVIVFVGVAHSLLKFWNIIYLQKHQEGHSITSLVQAVKIIVTIFGAIIIISILFNVPTGVILTALGTASAILLLIFKDTILGFVGSIQLSTNKMVLLGDWIEMPQYGADGRVIDISLVAVKVKNWDNTVTTIPTYALVANSVKNWRAMSETGRRRIKRFIYMDMTSVKFVDRELLEKLRKIQSIKDYLDHKDKEIEAYNTEHLIDDSVALNGRRQTNLGIFRTYIVHYLMSHHHIDNETSTFLVRQLQPTDMGIPLEIYVFTNTAVWAEYENIQSDIFDHILASVEYFDLHVYQRPSWNDYRTKELFSMKANTGNEQ